MAVDKVVAQVSNLLYRNASSLRVRQPTRPDGDGNVLPIGNRRYSRLETVGNLRYAELAGLLSMALSLRIAEETPQKEI